MNIDASGIKYVLENVEDILRLPPNSGVTFVTWLLEQPGFTLERAQDPLWVKSKYGYWKKMVQRVASKALEGSKVGPSPAEISWLSAFHWGHITRAQLENQLGVHRVRELLPEHKPQKLTPQQEKSVIQAYQWGRITREQVEEKLGKHRTELLVPKTSFSR